MARCITTSPATARELPLIGDPRNDENIMLSQLHMALLRFHNCVVEDVKDDLGPGFTNEEIFHQAQRVVRWHYQWMVLNEFLKKTVGAQLVADVLRDRPKFYKWRTTRTSPSRSPSAPTGTRLMALLTLSSARCRPTRTPSCSRVNQATFKPCSTASCHEGLEQERLPGAGRAADHQVLPPSDPLQRP
jgi:hypothetical protein